MHRPSTTTIVRPRRRRTTPLVCRTSYSCNIVVLVVWLLRTAVVTHAFSLGRSGNNNNLNNNNNNPSISATGTTKNLATQILQGVGVVTAAQRNAYNLARWEDIVTEWTVYRYQRVNDNNVDTYRQVRLGCRTSRQADIMVDTVTVQFPRTANGLGLELEEIASNGDSGGVDNDADEKDTESSRTCDTTGKNRSSSSRDGSNGDTGLGITIVTRAISDQSRAVDIIPGDSLVRIVLIRTTQQQQQQQRSLSDRRTIETEERFEVNTECLDFDATVRQIQSLPPYDESTKERWTVTVKRLRRRPKVAVTVRYPPQSNRADQKVSLYAGDNLRQALLVKGISINDPLAQRFDSKAPGSNCGAGGLCRTCRVNVDLGADLLNPQRPAERTMLQRENNPRTRLACKAIVGYGMKEGQLVVKAYPDQWETG